MYDLTGQTLKSYQVHEMIGAGGFGAVYRASQAILGREVAIKVILPEYANRSEFIRRFETEAQLVARLEHPHIVPLYDYWREPDCAYLVMRYLRGGNLRQLLRDQGSLSLREAMLMLNQIASALAFAHRNGVIHRDIKSDNIFFDEDQNFYLGDFGIAKNTSNFDDPSQLNVMGTPAYLSPEQIRGEVLTNRSDIYSLGIVAYEVLTGVKPFFDFSPATVLYKQLNTPLPKIQELRPDLPISLDEVLGKATAKQDNKRFADALEFAKEFARIAQSFDLDALDTQERQRIIALQPPTEFSETLTLTNPFKGLRAFQQVDSPEFFGRDSLVARLIEQFDEDKIEEAFLAVVGASGSGKSSVVKAGLLPAIRNGALQGHNTAYIAEMVPSTHPFEELEAALLSVASQPMPNLLQQLRTDSRGFITAVKTILPNPDQRMVLLIDQFEEIFTLVSREERQHFIDAMVETVLDANSRIKIIITMRADFYDKPLFHASFGELIRKRTEVVLPLTPQEITDVVLRPLERIGYTAEPSLVSTIVHDVSQQAGALPLLQYALTELFERREEKTLRLRTYENIGGISGAVAKRAEEIYLNFDATHQATTRQLFLRLVALGENSDTRRRVTQAELLSIGNTPTPMRDVIDAYGRYRLLTFDSDALTRTATVELAHEAVIQHWGRLHGWLEESREAVRLQQRLTQATDEWLQAQQDPSFLMVGVRLQQIEDIVKDSDILLTATEKAFLDASIQHRQAIIAENLAEAEREKQRQLQELERESTKRRQYRLLAVGASLMAIVFLALAVYALFLSNEANRNLVLARAKADESLSLRLSNGARDALAEHNPELGLALAQHAIDTFAPPLPDVLRTFSMAVYAPGARWVSAPIMGAIISTTISNDGVYSASSNAGGEIIAWNNQTGAIILNYQSDVYKSNDLVFLPDHTTLLVGGSDGYIRELDALSGREIRQWQAHVGGVSQLTLSNDGTMLVSSGANGQIAMWAVSTGSLVRILSDELGAVLSLAISPNGQRIAVGTGDYSLINAPVSVQERLILVWDVNTGELRHTIKPHSGTIRNLAFSPDSRFIATGLWENADIGTIRIYNVETGDEDKRLYGHTAPIADVVFSANGLFLYTASWDKTVMLFDLTRGVSAQMFVGFQQPILSLNLASDGRHILLGQGNLPAQRPRQNDQSQIIYWDTLTGDLLQQFNDAQDSLWDVDISADGNFVASGSGPLRRDADKPITSDTGFYIWDAHTGAQVMHISTLDTVSDVVFDTSGQYLFTSSWDGTIIQWDIANKSSIQTFRTRGIAVNSIALSPNGKVLLGGYNDGFVRVWDIDTGQLVRSIGVDIKRINRVVYNNSGNLFATAGETGLVRLWDGKTYEQIMTIKAHDDAVSNVVFSTDETKLASSSWDDKVYLWDITSGTRLQTFSGHSGNTFGLAFTSDDIYLLSSSADSTIRLWDVASGQEVHRYVGHNNWVMDVEIFADNQHFVSVSQDHLLKIWHIAPTVESLQTYATQTRQHRDLTCAELAFYGVVDECATS
jgi:WD40 repeat protein/serine/threonine protein kinase/energy-coupling factor transporter ATP-binding protein EcfA2